MQGIEELAEIERFVRGAGYGADRIRIDPSVVRGLEYYTGPVFEAELTFESQGRGRPAGPLRLGRRRRALRRARRALSRGAGSGDRLFDRRLAPARGVARDQEPDRRRGSRRPAPSSCSRSTATRSRWPTTSASSRACAAPASRPNSISGSGGMNAQLKYADRRRSRVAVIQGSNERDAPGGPQVTIRDLKLGAELAQDDQGPRRLSRTAPARPIRRARGRAGRAGARGAGAVERRHFCRAGVVDPAKQGSSTPYSSPWRANRQSGRLPTIGAC